jgi:hypothetical protein
MKRCGEDFLPMSRLVDKNADQGVAKGGGHMADEPIRSDEEAEVEGHGFHPDAAEGNAPVAQDEEPEVEGHGFHPTTVEGNAPDLTEGNAP